MKRLALSLLPALLAAVASGCGSDCATGLTKCGETCVDLKTSNANCGACGTACGASDICSASACRLSFSGTQVNVPISTLGSWTQCFLETYDQSGATLTTDVPAGCTKANVLVACRQTGATTLTLAAMAPRADVFFVTGNPTPTNNNVHTANGVGWYFDNDWSMGFAEGGDPVSLNECDVAGAPNNDRRLCWHTLSSGVGGYRCGATSGLNFSTAWERIVFHAD